MKRSVLCCLLAWTTSLHAQTAAQATLPTTKLEVDGHEITAELADTDAERETGLMFRKKLAPDSGMLFSFAEPNQWTFWMKNTLIPLSIAYISSSGTILEIHAAKALDETPIPSKFPTVLYVLEMDAGWFDQNHVLAGDRISGLPGPARQ